MEILSKVMMVFAAILACYELLPTEKQILIDSFLKIQLKTKRILRTALLYIFVILVLFAFLQWAAYIIAVIFIVLLTTLLFILKNIGIKSVMDGEYGTAVVQSLIGIFSYMAIIYSFAFISWLVPLAVMDFVVYPYEYLSSLSRNNIAAWLIPEFTAIEFRQQFGSISSDILNSWFGVEQISDSAWRFISWPWIYLQSSQTFSFFGLLIILLAWFIVTVIVILLSLAALFYPFFHLANYIKIKSKLEKMNVPIMAIIVGAASTLLGVF